MYENKGTIFIKQKNMKIKIKLEMVHNTNRISYNCKIEEMRF